MQGKPCWRIPLVAWLPISLAIVAESVSNALRAYGLGSHLERFTVTAYGIPVSISGAVLVLAAIAVSLTQARAAWVALTPGPVKQRLIAGAAAGLLLTVSITAMASHILEAQRAKVSDEDGLRAKHDRVKAAYDKALAEQQSLGSPRPVAVIQAEVQSTKIDMTLWRRSNQCADITREDTKDACGPILALYKERGAAARKAELDPVVNRLRDQLAALGRPEAASAEETTVSGYWAWIMGLAVVFVATFGTVIFARPEMPPPLASEPVALGVAAPAATPEPPAALAAPEPETVPAGPPAATKQEALADLLRLLESGATISSQDELVQRWRCSKGCASRWLKSWTEEGLIPERSMVGRCKQIKAA